MWKPCVVLEADEAQPTYYSARKQLHASLVSSRGTHNRSTDKGREKNEGSEEVKYDVQ